MYKDKTHCVINKDVYVNVVHYVAVYKEMDVNRFARM